jgi:septum formation protein
MLKNMSGQRLQFYTGFTLIHKAKQQILTDFDITFVKIKKLTDTEINNYIGTGEPFQAAGALISEQKGSVLIQKLTGDPSNLIGLPLYKLHKALKKFGIQAF